MPSKFAAPIELKVSLFVPPHNPATVLISRLGDLVRERSKGRLLLRIFHSGRLGATVKQYDLARTGAVDIAYMIHSATPGRFPLTELAALPPVAGGIAGTAALQRLLPAHLAQEHAGVRVLFLVANTPMAIHSTRTLRGLGDLKGKRVGHTGRIVAATLEAIGAVPVTILPLDIRAALESGEIDATSMTYEAALVLQLGDLVRFSYELNANTITFGLVMNQRRYDGLSPDLRGIVDETLGARAGLDLARMLVAAVDDGKRHLSEAGVTIVAPSRVDQASIDGLAKALCAKFIAELTERNLPAREVFDALRKH